MSDPLTALWRELLTRLAAPEAPADAQTDALWRAAEGGFALWRAAAAPVVDAAGSEPGRAVLARLLDPDFWLHPAAHDPDPELTRFLRGPEPSELGLFGRIGLRETREYRALAAARAGHRRLILGAWARAFEAWSKRPAKSDPVAEWAARAGAEMATLHDAPTFLDSLAALLLAAADLRAREQALIADWLAREGLPTRDDLDALARDLADLRAELAALKRG